ncbi:MAG: GNAT family N-acetyltransferase [Dactylosporangium sp.]|nr:GNAT family N-acetyltransferase [Dactylosporangium sp.]NNJ59372.1 GNAT family N-acetyltransferase [Dactylosporangium sp.]
MLIDHYPMLGLRIRTPRVELRLPLAEDLAELADLAAEGIHDPAATPFLVPWTDQPPAERARSVVQYHWLRRGTSTPQDWSLLLGVFLDGTAVGQQDIGAHDFAITREVTTGSWLGLRYQGQGIGTQMRAAVLHLAFAELGAEEAVSGALDHNAASLGVSRKLGYQPDGIQRHVVRGAVAAQVRLRLTRARWERHRTVPVTVEGLAPCLPHFGISDDQVR